MPKDIYSSYIELVAKGIEVEGIDYRIVHLRRGSPVAIVAPHGGTIEPWTTNIASAIAGQTFSFYSFEGLRPCDHHELHITSDKFDEPTGCLLVAESDIVIAIHGLKNTESKAQFIEVGGLAVDLRDLVIQHLVQADFDARVAKTAGKTGTSQENICNRGRAKRGIQLEITRSLRDAIFNEPARPRLSTFAAAVRSAIVAIEAEE